MANEGCIVTPEGRLVFPQLFEPKPIKRNGKEVGDPIYSCSFLFAPEQIEDLKKKALDVARAKWGGRNFNDEVKAGTFKLPFSTGAKEKAKADAKGKDGLFYEGTIVLKTKSKYRPGVVDDKKQEIIDPNKVYSGCYGYAEVNFVAYEGVSGGSDGVTAYLNFVLKSRDGDRLAGRTAADVFSGIEGGSSDYNPVEAGDDEIPF